jgi:hypothetical protein
MPTVYLSHRSHGISAESPLDEQLAAALGPTLDLERELGGGGMSRVYLARNRRLGRRIVVKVLAPELASGVTQPPPGPLSPFARAKIPACI